MNHFSEGFKLSLYYATATKGLARGFELISSFILLYLKIPDHCFVESIDKLLMPHYLEVNFFEVSFSCSFPEEILKY